MLRRIAAKVRDAVVHRLGYWSHTTKRVGSDRQHLDATVEWLARAQDACQGNGVSILYDLRKGEWHEDPYPETSGYILATFLKYAELSGDNTFIERAIRIGDWEIEIQRDDGAVLSSVRRDVVRVFNTGQVMLGWCELFEQTRDSKYLDAARRASSFLLDAQDEDGAWRNDTHCGARTYHARVAWALLRVAELANDDSLIVSANRNLRWTLRQQNDQGWFKNCGFDSSPPITHVIGYTIRGLLESWQLAEKNQWTCMPSTIHDSLAAALGAIVRIVQDMRIGRRRGVIPSAFNDTWKPTGSSSCLTGNAQLAICLIRWAQITSDTACVTAADSMIDALKRLQNIETPDIGVRGGLPGSFPIATDYQPNQLPNWAAKFMADALLMRILKKEMGHVRA